MTDLTRPIHMYTHRRRTGGEGGRPPPWRFGRPNDIKRKKGKYAQRGCKNHDQGGKLLKGGGGIFARAWPSWPNLVLRPSVNSSIYCYCRRCRKSRTSFFLQSLAKAVYEMSQSQQNITISSDSVKSPGFNVPRGGNGCRRQRRALTCAWW